MIGAIKKFERIIVISLLIMMSLVVLLATIELGWIICLAEMCVYVGLSSNLSHVYAKKLSGNRRLLQEANREILEKMMVTERREGHP